MYGQNWQTGAAGSASDIPPDVLLQRREMVRRDLENLAAVSSYRQSLAAGGLRYGLPSDASRLIYGAPTTAESLLRQRAALQQRQAVAAASLVSLESRLAQRENTLTQRRDSLTAAAPGGAASGGNSNAMAGTVPQMMQTKTSKIPPANDIIEIDDSSDDEPIEKVIQPPVATKKKKRQSGFTASMKTSSTKTSKKRKTKHQSTSLSSSSSSKHRDMSSLSQTNPPQLRQRLKTAIKQADRKQPVVILQNWSRQGLLQELSRSEIDRVQGVLQLLLYHVTGYTAATAPENVVFPPSKVEMTITQINEFSKAVVKAQAEHLKQAIDGEFFKCASIVEEVARRPAPSQATKKLPPPALVPAKKPGISVIDSVLPPSLFNNATQANSTTSPMVATGNLHLQNNSGNGVSLEENTEILNKLEKTTMELRDNEATMRRQQEEINQLRRDLAAANNSHKKAKEEFETERSHLKSLLGRCENVHKKSLKAYLRASVHSLRSMRQSIDSESDEEAEEGEGGVEAEME